MDLSVVIINHNTRELTHQTVQAVLETTHRIQYEIIIVDNSTDPQQQYELSHEKVFILSGVENKGFGNACNLGVQRSCGRYILFLNSDTVVGERALDDSVAYLDAHSDTAVVGIRTLLEDGSLDHGCKRGFPTPMSALYYFLGMDKRHPESPKYGAYRQTFLDEHQTSEVDSVSGAFLMISKSVFDQIGGFDEDYFMYGEDLDLCYRVKMLGYKVVYYADVSMTHFKGQSGLNTNPTVIYHFYNAMILFYDKHYKGKYNILVTGLIHLAVKAKYALAVSQAKRRNKQADG
ncbi:glycosyltransferase, group 2 family protein [[Clostridium] methylpentosum DSM 5476]|uniref:Glycosyltransferase, group 2 family protein n=1 Tax=[Clostridium] methylpentosum DSM 5476 TaxID=537013 RepID=C0E8K0_9FIRM|nr:glycosyltransferase, group 2 family protein [[Clostridium] methylpentosum DSM 5476]MDY3988095.1 glycosyltransferase family 2 protein [Massilioclostridium sp.]MEE1491575.1 glycosyltransferase family 2 protein [Massilioclostridium sp.]